MSNTWANLLDTVMVFFWQFIDGAVNFGISVGEGFAEAIWDWGSANMELMILLTFGLIVVMAIRMR